MDAIKMMQEGGNPSGVAAAMINDCSYLASDFPRVHFKHSYREANVVAQELVGVGRGSAEQTWLDNPTYFLAAMM
jgi:hypothetical protein